MSRAKGVPKKKATPTPKKKATAVGRATSRPTRVPRASQEETVAAPTREPLEKRAREANVTIPAPTEEVSMARAALTELDKLGAQVQAARKALVRKVVARETAQAQTARVLARASRALAWVELLVPRRIANEEIGDAMEVIGRLIMAQRPMWCVWIKVTTTIVWAVLNAVRTSGPRVVRRKG